MNNLTKSYTHVLTGYIGDITFLHGIAHVIDDLKKQNKDLLYMCDPVLGDHGRLYVPQELVQAFKTVLIPRADIITPNHFETSLLTDTPLDDILKHKFDVIELLDKMHAMGPRTVIITGIPSLDQSTITLYASKYEQQSNENKVVGEKRSIYQVQFPKLNSFFTGTGDLIASLLLANMREDVPFAKQLERAVASVQHVLKYTAEQGGGELRLVECWPGIVNPRVDAYHAEPVQLPSTIN